MLTVLNETSLFSAVPSKMEFSASNNTSSLEYGNKNNYVNSGCGVFIGFSSVVYDSTVIFPIQKEEPLYYIGQPIDSETAAYIFADKFTLIAVDNVTDMGISNGRLLCVSDSFDDLGEYIQSHNGLEDEHLHFVTGSNLF